MMLDYLKTNFRYDAWATKALLEAYMSYGFEVDSISRVFTHVINAQRVWLNRIGELNDSFDWEVVLTQPQLKEQHMKISGILSQYLEHLDAAKLSGAVSFQRVDGTPTSSTLMDILTHLYHHSMYHRGQIALRMRENMIVVPPTDYIVFSRLNA